MLGSTPHIVQAHDVLGGPTGMGLVVEGMARAILDRGWRLTVVAAEVTTDLPGRWSFVRVPVDHAQPPLIRYELWAARARSAVRRLSSDLVHGHGPSLLPVSHLFTCHHLAFSAHEHGVRSQGSGLEGAARRLEAWANRTIDHRRYQRRPGTPFVSFVSGFLREEFRRHYGKPRGGWVLPTAAPPFRPVTDRERCAARERWGAGLGRLAVGYMGGDDVRKGIRYVEDLACHSDLAVLLAGRGTERLTWPGCRGLGFVDPDDLLQACDVVVAPALFDAAPLAILQAVARGVPVVVAGACGWAEPLVRHGAGVRWAPGQDLAAAARAAAAVGQSRCRSFTEEFSIDSTRDLLFDAYATVLAANASG